MMFDFKISTPFVLCAVGQPCPLPPLPDNAQEPKEKVFAGDSVTLTCISGYVAAGNMTITCNTGRIWTTTSAYCSRKKIVIIFLF